MLMNLAEKNKWRRCPTCRIYVEKWAGADVSSTTKVGCHSFARGGAAPAGNKRRINPFFIFMEEFKQKYREEHPNNHSASAIGKAADAKWKSLSRSEKAFYVTKYSQFCIG
ncbi:hypothetical protein M0R45_006300 [Rubus argutus]|uniref:HMG box domain-containing protein n=1 Tax=Rubus argutus TaxID=59490 RepID=A0AAW1YQF4_RUBAR